ncbi:MULTISPECIES: 7-carboxy-7-deazaguanine synthase [unclassified Sphingomonas]|uniref:7-carboxy-7-deazaguanine synthase n=1 Tax=unclassified Sphingomonas TaxID=196159 RepID=UPI0006F5C1B0|nr:MULTISPECIES: 7-carboxy-7-deazaguanine synthase [unclassified Sphingomonas]KQM64740.1 7-carboxy-7-deazaguanine synthase [Sphingomonas sp. Leaf16]KQN16873.1 7-carboxy-7-deazaguanine synthase [Sphingomonas sp. Leaf29]KQN22854.1 7-carboxy-7-deazaguanine synthase [Sphingomonas sp. Leaf32]
MTYSVKEMFLTLQGEGVHAGRRAVFVRFAGCNLWTGREQDRATAICRFCDTDFVGTDGVGGGKFADAEALVAAVAAQWGNGTARRFVVLTGGEPMLQIDDALVIALHDAGFLIAIESNGTIAAHPGIDWVCISPKEGSEVVQRRGDELKLVWPQDGIDVDTIEQWDFAHHLVQPMDAVGMEAAHRDAAIGFAMDRPKWRLSLQTHKLLGLR